MHTEHTQCVLVIATAKLWKKTCLGYYCTYRHKNTQHLHTYEMQTPKHIYSLCKREKEKNRDLFKPLEKKKKLLNFLPLKKTIYTENCLFWVLFWPVVVTYSDALFWLNRPRPRMYWESNREAERKKNSIAFKTYISSNTNLHSHTEWNEWTKQKHCRTHQIHL